MQIVINLVFSSALFILLFLGQIVSGQAQVLSYFTWDNIGAHPAPNSPMVPDIGPPGISCGNQVRQRTPGNSDYGLSPGFNSGSFPCNNSAAWGGAAPGTDASQTSQSSCRVNINMLLDNSGAWAGTFDQPEMDFSIWYRRRSESDSAWFFTRGQHFKFGMAGSKIAIKYAVHNGGVPQYIPCCQSFSQVFGFFAPDDIPNDNAWRLYRFNYNQASGIATIYVNGVVAWSTNIIDQSPGLPMYWPGAPPMQIGFSMDGLGWMQAILDDATISVPGVLPIELGFFKAEVNTDYKINLQWETLKELNNSHFVIDRSLDGQNWTYLGRVNGAGTTQESREYSFTDPSPKKGENHYRLRQSDFNGSENILNYATAFLNYSKTGLVAIYPNPLNSENQLNLLFESVNPGQAKVLIFDTQGKQMSDYELTIEEGMNHFPVSVDELEAGLYFVKVFAGGKVYADKFLKR